MEQPDFPTPLFGGYNMIDITLLKKYYLFGYIKKEPLEILFGNMTANCLTCSFFNQVFTRLIRINYYI